jgi:hypothetical protein
MVLSARERLAFDWYDPNLRDPKSSSAAKVRDIETRDQRDIKSSDVRLPEQISGRKPRIWMTCMWSAFPAVDRARHGRT